MEDRFDLPYMSVVRVADRLGLNPDAVVMLVKKGDLPALVQVGNRRMFQTNEIERWMKERHDV